MRSVLVLAALHCLAFIDRTMIGGALPLLRESVPMTDAQAGWIVGTAFALPYGVAALAVAALRRGRAASTTWLLGGAITWTAGSLLTGLAGSFVALTATRALLGLGQGVFVPMAIAWLVDATPPATRARSLGLFTGGATFGRSIALLAVGLLLPLLGRLSQAGEVETWRWLFVLTALPNVAILLVLAAYRSPAPQPENRQADGAGTNWIMLLPAFLIAVAPVVLAQAVTGWMPTLLMRSRGLSTRDAALLFGVVTLVAAPAGPVLGGWALSRLRWMEPRMPVLVLAGLALTLGLLMVVVLSPSLAVSVVGMILMLLTLGSALFAGLFNVQLLIPPASRVAVNGIYLAFVTTVGVGAGPLLAGMISAAGGESGPALGHALLVTGAVATAGCALAVAASGRAARRFLAGAHP